MAASIKEQYEKYAPTDRNFYRDHYPHVIMGAMVIILLLIIAIGVVLYQSIHQPLPVYKAVQADNQQMLLSPYEEPNLLPDTILEWASKAATIAYTFDFVNYNKQIAAARPYFTDAGWADYMRSVNALIQTIVKNQIFVTGVVSGVPVVSNQGELPGRGYVWRVQIPFLVSYQSSETVRKDNFIVVITIVRVPTNINPQGIGIDQFVMS